MSIAKSAFLENKNDILILWHIHKEVSGKGSANNKRADVLNRSAIVFVSACWESYVEYVAMEAFDYLIANARIASVVPQKVKALASRELREAKDERAIWELADDGWRAVLQRHRHSIREKWIRDFNTPKTLQVNALFSDLLGMSPVSHKWNWPNTTHEQAALQLDYFLTIRGNISHRTKHQTVVHKSAAKSFLNHVARLVDVIDTSVADHVSSQVGSRPW